MKVYIAREDATGHDLEDLILGVYADREKAFEACNDQLACWRVIYEYVTDSGWVEYQELQEGGMTRELCLEDPIACLIYKVYESEVQ